MKNQLHEHFNDLYVTFAILLYWSVEIHRPVILGACNSPLYI